MRPKAPTTGRRVRAATRGFRSVAGLMSTRRFFDLLARRSARTAGEVDRAIEKRGLRELTVFACDSSGFSRRTHEFGILQFLSVMTRCYDGLIPLLERRGGICLSHNADNILAVFEDVTPAAQAAVDMNRWLRRRNRRASEAERFHVCIGIHHGPVIRLRDNVFGATVNVAAKIGEDLAGREEILLTGEAVGRLEGRVPVQYLRSTDVGGRIFELHRVEYSA